jgi:hypothetical protein
MKVKVKTDLTPTYEHVILETADGRLSYLSPEEAHKLSGDLLAAGAQASMNYINRKIAEVST